MPTIKGLRRRGYTADALNAFCTDIGVSRNDNTIEVTVQCKHTCSIPTCTHSKIYVHCYCICVCNVFAEPRAYCHLSVYHCCCCVSYFTG
jgi:hypothetical protein